MTEKTKNNEDLGPSNDDKKSKRLIELNGVFKNEDIKLMNNDVWRDYFAGGGVSREHIGGIKNDPYDVFRDYQQQKIWDAMRDTYPSSKSQLERTQKELHKLRTFFKVLESLSDENQDLKQLIIMAKALMELES